MKNPFDWFQRFYLGAIGAISAFNTALILICLYYLVVTPIGLMRRLVNRAMGDKASGNTNWKTRDPASARIDFGKQY